ncbi:MAG TPA: hypothetical protein VL948_17110 [Verrucomicrobiae bacterium]|jgi:hypothetical protein|nr:hypothetical protein [Verrucomicrobiae bacterium]
MGTTLTRCLAAALAPTAAAGLVLALGGPVMSQTAPAPPPATKSAETKPGVVVAETTTLHATVEAVDPGTREVTLKGSKGNVVTIKAGPEVKNFDQIHVGDVLTARYLESVALVVRKAGEGPSANESRTVQVAPKGHKPAARIVETKEVTATVEAIDHAARTVTLRGPEGNARTIKVDPSVKRLNEVKKGDQVVARYTEGLAISVKTPPPAKAPAPAPAPATK